MTDYLLLCGRLSGALLELNSFYGAKLLPADRERILELARERNPSSFETHAMQMAKQLVICMEKYGVYMPDEHRVRFDLVVRQYWQVTGNEIGPTE